jgi:hypothetical protein
MLQEFVFGDDPVAIGQKVLEQLKCLEPERHARTSAVKYIALGIKGTIAKDVVHGPTSSRWPSGERIITESGQKYHENTPRIRLGKPVGSVGTVIPARALIEPSPPAGARGRGSTRRGVQ